MQAPRSVKKDKEVPHVLEKSFTSIPAADPGESGSPSAAHGEPHTAAGGCLKKVGSLWEAQAGGSWQDL